MQKVFKHSKHVYLGDMSIYGNVYFANYFEWQGEAREAMFKSLMGDPKAFFESGLKMVTLNASMKFNGEINLMDVVHIEIRPVKVTITTVELEFAFRKNDDTKIVAKGIQRVGFVGKNGHAVPLPDAFLLRGGEYLNDEMAESVKRIEKKVRWIRNNSSLS